MGGPFREGCLGLYSLKTHAERAGKGRFYIQRHTY
jgi:hypothetical protein